MVFSPQEKKNIYKNKKNLAIYNNNNTNTGTKTIIINDIHREWIWYY